MSPTIDERTATLLESDASGNELQERLNALESERVQAAMVIEPDEGDVPLEADEARDLARRFRAIRDEHIGEMAAPRSVLPGDPGRVAAALYAEGIARMEGLDQKDLRAAQRELAEAFVDLQSFRPDDQTARLLTDATPRESSEADALTTARATQIARIREDPSVTGNRNALRELDIRIGDARKALDAVNGYREKQAFGLIAMVGLGALVVIAIAVFIVIQVVS